MKGAGRGSPRRLWPRSKSPVPPPDLTTCERKTAYATRDLAHASAMQFSDAERVGLTVYLCRDCRLFHLGHKR